MSFVIEQWAVSCEAVASLIAQHFIYTSLSWLLLLFNYTSTNLLAVKLYHSLVFGRNWGKAMSLYFI